MIVDRHLNTFCLLRLSDKVSLDVGKTVKKRDKQLLTIHKFLLKDAAIF